MGTTPSSSHLASRCRSDDLGGGSFRETHAVGDSHAVVRVSDDVEPWDVLQARLDVGHAIDVTDERLRARADVPEDLRKLRCARDTEKTLELAAHDLGELVVRE